MVNGATYIDDNTDVKLRTIDAIGSISLDFDQGIRILSQSDLSLFVISNMSLMNRHTGENYDSFQNCTIVPDDNSMIDITIDQPASMTIRRVKQDTGSRADLLANRVKTIGATITGTLIFQYSTKPLEYQLLNQPFTVSSDDFSINVNLSLASNNSSISLYGKATEASITNIDLFPSFWGWYRENVYMIPLTLITTIWGSINLMKNSSKKKDE